MRHNIKKIVYNTDPEEEKTCVICGELLPKGIQKQFNKRKNQSMDDFLLEVEQSIFIENTHPQCRNKKSKK